jgi:hypothetical protein
MTPLCRLPGYTPPPRGPGDPPDSIMLFRGHCSEHRRVWHRLHVALAAEANAQRRPKPLLSWGDNIA